MADAAENKDAANIKPEQNGETATTEAPAPPAAQQDAAQVKSEKSEDVKAEESGAVTEDASEKHAKDTNEDTKDDATTEKRKESPEPAADGKQDRKRPRGGDRPFQNKKHIQSRFEDQAESSDADDIRRQVEFYFSDSNLPIDDFLLSRCGGSQNFPIDLKMIHNFKRMRHFQPYSAVRDAVKASTFLNLDDQDHITRKVPLDSKFTDDVEKNRTLVHQGNMSRSIYAKGFGDEQKNTHLDIEAFFEPYGPLNSVRLRRGGRGEFKGSVFVEFETDELQQQFLELDTKPKWNGKDLDIMSKQAYVDFKHNGILEGAVRPRSPMRSNGGRGGRGGRGRGSDNWDKRGSKDRFDKDDWKSRRDRDQEEDRRGRGGRGRGYKPHRGGRGGRGGRYRSPDFDERKRRGSDVSEHRDGSPAPSKKRARDDEGEEASEAKKVKAVEGDAKEVQAEGGAREVQQEA